MVVKQELEPQLEPIFDQHSYGYRLGKSTRQAVESCRRGCWKYDWVVDLDIKGLFSPGLVAGQAAGQHAG